MRITLLSGITALALANTPLLACTSLSIADNQGHFYHGRTMELESDNPPSSLTYYPAGMNFKTQAPDGSPGIEYTSRFNILAISAPLLSSTSHELVEGLNSEGLAFSENMMPRSEITLPSTDHYSQTLPFIDLGQWALANFTSTDELKAHIGDVRLWSSTLKNLGNMKSDFHYAFYDRAGKSIVVEVTGGDVHVYDNPTGVMTNGPAFPWHLENLNNYTQLTNVDKSVAHLHGLSLTQPDSGIATAQLPSSDTSVGRFIRAAFYSHYAHHVSDQDEAIRELAHIMNRFDRPKNASTSTMQEGNISSKEITTEYTVWTTLSDLTRGNFYIRGYNNLNFQKVSFSDFEHQNKPVYQLINQP